MTRLTALIKFRADDFDNNLITFVITLIKNLFCSSLGKKYIMAVSGVVLFLFAVGHLIGNLQVFIGPEAINRYGAFLQGMTELLWPVRIVLFTLVVLHIWSASRLTLENRAARPVPYTTWNPTVASYASRTMFMSGLIIAAFIIFHILHYTVMTPAVNLTGKDFADHALFTDPQGRHDIYKMLIVGFSNPIVSIFYIIAVGLLSLHVSHGARAMFQSLGMRARSYQKAVDCFAAGIAVFLFVGYSSIPLAILLGIVKEASK